ncbi:flagellin [Gammaproteobacteria bacterium]|jgi:flagellin|nr:flagellin [Gammaproteobacteria bacterium]MDB2376378.1 flagellin [Gammaproteobacteria bacterium]
MTTINTNVSSLIAKNAIGQNERAMSQAMTRLSTGSRINSARDDAAGLAISERMSSQISSLKMAARNSNDAISMLQTADGATKEISSMLGRMRELAVQSASGTYTASDRDALDLEFKALLAETDRIAANTEWNGVAILSGDGALETKLEVEKAFAIQLGTDAAQTMSLSLSSWRPKVAVDAQMTAADGTAKDGVDAKAGESNVVTFTDMDANDVLTIGGLTITANASGATAAHIVDAIESLSSGTAAASVPSITNATVTGTLTGFSTSAKSTLNITFTSTAESDDYTLASTGTGASHASVASVVAGTDNASAYGKAALYWGGTPTSIDIDTADNAGEALTQIDLAIAGASSERAKYGSYMSRLGHATDNLNNVATNTAASRSQIADADYAAETTELARTQIISQASTAMLAQANQVKQTVLALLK